MARALSRTAGFALLCGAALPAGADCFIDANGEITNPFAPGCGDVIFTYTANNNAGANGSRAGTLDTRAERTSPTRAGSVRSSSTRSDWARSRARANNRTATLTTPPVFDSKA